ncbi:unnamed protein product [Cylicocyclus nassatus]|uniref:Uncharacterized protein n=1 Tax=Cylicocyclus nassatus TaxID=53992 RepID=A0AA36DSK8_CYLNA|nr:unnamed protein product [Cylicocyclus nassatus]
MDLEERKERFAEALNSRVLAEYIKVVNIPILMRKDFDQMLEDILKLVGYDRNDDRHPLTWPRPCGIGASTMGIMAKTSYTFWKWLTTNGKDVLRKYNLDHWTKVMILQEKTIRQTDLNRLW